MSSPLVRNSPAVNSGSIPAAIPAPSIPVWWIGNTDLPSGVCEATSGKLAGVPNGTGYTVLSRLTEPVFALMPALSPTSMISPDASLKST